MTAFSPTRRGLPALVALAALIPSAWLALRYADLPQFGKYQDDGLFVIAGKSLHEAQGFRIANLPGKPFQTKYQPLFPALLAAVWAIDGRFPENLRWFSALAWAAFAAYLSLACAVFRAYGFSPWSSAGMLWLLGLNPWLLYWGLLPMSDVTAAALILAVFWILQSRRNQPRWWIAAGVLVAAACLTKVMAILIIPAIWAGGWRRASWKRSLTVTLPGIAAFGGWTLWAGAHRPALDHPVLWYYTDYAREYLRSGGLQALPRIVQNNIASLIGVAGNSAVYNLADSMWGRFVSVVLLAAAISGALRFVRRTARPEYPVFCALLALVLLGWNFSPNTRLLAPALPMFAIGLAEELAHARTLVRRSWESRKRSDRIAARLCAAAAAGGVLYAVIANIMFLAGGLPRMLDQDRVLSVRDRAAYEWCKRELPAAAVVLAHNDTALYLYSGLSTLKPVPSSVAFYNEDTAAELENFTHFDQLADFFGVTHIVLTPDDFADFSAQQREWIREALLTNPRHRQVHSEGGVTVLAIERRYLESGGAALATRLNQAPGQ